MDSSADVDIEQDTSLSSSPRPLRKNITIKLKSDKTSPATRRRATRSNKSSKKDDTSDNSADGEVVDAPIFKTMEPGEPVHHNKRLRWDHKVNLLGEKVVDPLIHCCEGCSLPILIYGRMIQCKHVFCFTCAKKTEKFCPRCGEAVQRIEQSALGTVFLCTYGGSKHGINGCRRTYLSQRDLNAHIAHRHLKMEQKNELMMGSDHIPAAALKASLSQSQSRPVTPATSRPQEPVMSPSNQQALLEQFNAAVRQVSGELLRNSAAAIPPTSRPAQEEVYHRAVQPEMAPVRQPPQQQHPPAMSSAGHIPPQPPVVHQTPPLHHHPAYPLGPPVSVAPPPGSQSGPPQSHPPVSAPDSYPSSIPVLAGSRTTNLISVHIQEEGNYGRSPEPPSYHTHPPPGNMPPPNYPPQPMGHAPQYPQVSMPAGIHQPPPGLPHMSMPGGPGQNPAFPNPMRPPPGAIPHGPPSMASGPPPPRLPVPPLRHPQGPPGGPPGRFPGPPGPFDGRGPWPGPPNHGPMPPGPPRGPPPPGGPPRGPPPPGGPQARGPPPGGPPSRGPHPGGPPNRGPPPRGPPTAGGRPPPQQGDYNYY